MPDEREIRIQRLHALWAQGEDAYPHCAERTHTIMQILEQFDVLAGPEGSYTLVGRIRLRRTLGKITFLKY